MFNFDAEKMAKSAIDGLKKADKLPDLAGGAPEQVIEALRKLLAEAKKLVSAAPNKNKELESCIEKVQELLDSKDISTAAVTKLTTELTALIKGASSEAAAKPEGSAQRPTPAPKVAPVKSAPSTPAHTQAPACSVKAEAATKPVQFSDVAKDAYYYEAVQWAVQKGIASGTTETTFSPNDNCTRAQAITLLWRAAGSPVPKRKDNAFSDVKDTAYYHDAVLWASEHNIVSGTTFSPDDAVTRGQLATFLYREAGSPAVKNDGKFTDVAADSFYALAVSWVAAKGIASGTGEMTFSPDETCTRGQIVTFLYRAKK